MLWKLRLISCVLLSSIGSVIIIQPVQAAEETVQTDSLKLLRVEDLKRTSTKASDLLAQTESVKITGVKVNATDTGIEILLQSPSGNIPQPLNQNSKNIVVYDIPNATLALPEASEYSVVNPVKGIAAISVTQVTPVYVRISITGIDGLPDVKVTAGANGLTLIAIPVIASSEEEDIVVTGEQQNSRYRVPSASTATKTDTLLRDTPQSIQVVPRQVIEDQGATRIQDVLRNVSGVTPGADFGYGGEFYNIRGFKTERNLRNGFRVGTDGGFTGSFVTPSNIERVEVLKGPASVLYGQFEPGGIVNYVTKQPLSDPSYTAELKAGSYSFYQSSLDLTGPLTDDKRLLYRLNSSYQNFGSFVDFQNGSTFAIAPVISYKISDDTKLTLEYEYSRSNRTFYEGLPADPITFQIPISRNFGESGDRVSAATNSLNLALDHRFNDSLSLRSVLSGYFIDGNNEFFRPQNFRFDSRTSTDNTIARIYRIGAEYRTDFNWQTDLTAKFNTGSIQHNVLVGLEFTNGKSGYDLSDNVPVAPISIFNPIFGAAIPLKPNTGFAEDRNLNTIGLYVQDQITLLSNLKLLIGGRYDFSRGNSQFFLTTDGQKSPDPTANFYDEAFSPRVGIVYQPIEPISLYASYSRSFTPNNFADINGELLQPTRGTQYEVGVRTELGKLVASLAAYDITKTNILSFDPIDFRNVRAIGEVNSRGLEFDIGGEILSGWNVIASAFLNDALITVGDESNPKGNRLTGAPKNGASLWTTYKIQEGDLQGLGFGLGAFYVGDVEALHK